jgi:hypothetical protein
MASDGFYPEGGRAMGAPEKCTCKPDDGSRQCPREDECYENWLSAKPVDLDEIELGERVAEALRGEAE